MLPMAFQPPSAKMAHHNRWPPMSPFANPQHLARAIAQGQGSAPAHAAPPVQLGVFVIAVTAFFAATVVNAVARRWLWVELLPIPAITVVLACVVTLYTRSLWPAIGLVVVESAPRGRATRPRRESVDRYLEADDLDASGLGEQRARKMIVADEHAFWGKKLKELKIEME